MANTAFGQWWEENIYNPGRNILLGEDNGVGSFGQGILNAWYNLTGQKEKTSTYQYELALEDSKNERMAEDLEAAGLSKYGMTGAAPGSSFQGSEPTGLQKVSGVVDMFKALAEIKNVEADTGQKDAEAAAITAGIERDDAYYELASERQAADITRIGLENELTKQMTAESAQKVSASIQEQARAEAMHIYEMNEKFLSNALLSKENNYYGERTEADIAVKRSSAYLNQQYAMTQEKEREKFQKDIELACEKIATEVAQQHHLSAEDELLAWDAAMADIKYQIAQYDFQYSKQHYIRTTDPVTKIGGVNIDQFAHGLSKYFPFTFKGPSAGKKGGGGYAW